MNSDISVVALPLTHIKRHAVVFQKATIIAERLNRRTCTDNVIAEQSLEAVIAVSSNPAHADILLCPNPLPGVYGRLKKVPIIRTTVAYITNLVY